MKALNLERFKSLLRTASVKRVNAAPAVMRRGWMLQIEHTDHLYGQVLCTADGEPRIFASADSLIKTARDAGYKASLAFH